MNRNAFAAAVVLALGLTTALAAQNPPQTQPPAQPPTASQPAMAQPQSVTLEGCLVREKDVPGRAPNPAEKAGVMEDFILTSARIKTPGSAAPTAEQPTGTSGVKIGMYEVKGLEGKRLEEFVGQRVEIVGKIDPKDVTERSREKANPAGEPAGDLPEIEATSIKKVEGTCPPVK